MAKNYFEHEINVKYFDGILCKSTDWSWYIKYIQDNFELDFSVQTNSDFINKFSGAKRILEHFNKIHETVDSLEIEAEWLKDIDMISLFYVGKIDFESLILNNDYIRLLALYVLCAKIINETADVQYLLYMEIFRTYNIFEIIETELFEEEQEKIDYIIQQLQLDFSVEKNIYLDNIKHIFHYCDKPSDQLLLLCNNADSFSFNNSFDTKNVNVWEERYLLDILSLNYKNGQITPKITYRDGSTYPDFNLYTQEIFEKIRNYYKNTEIIFLVESIEYALFKKLPSQNTINKHFALWKEHIEGYDDKKGFLYLMCSSSEFLVSFFLDKSINMKDKLFEFHKALSKLNNVQYLSHLNKNKVPLPKSIKDFLKDYKIKKATEVDKITDAHSLNSYITDEEIVSIIDKEIFYKISDKFDEIILAETAEKPIFLASIFLDYLLFLIKIKNNRNIVSHEVSTEIIYIRGLWQDIYFEKCAKSMDFYENSINIPSEDVANLNLEMIEKPLAYACSCLTIHEKSLIETMISLSENPISSLFKNITISKDFPFERKILLDEKHPVDMIVKDAVEKLCNKNQHRFLNILSVEEYVSGIYKQITDMFNFYFYLFINTEKLYHSICDNNPRYTFIEFSDKPTLAHLTQLFPVLENKIREIGEVFGISPICEKKDKYSKLKEPSPILSKIIKLCYDETGKLSYAGDFLFIHFSMFAENGLNIRNECVHGNNYSTKDSNINFAFKITLFCLHLLDYRLELIRNTK